MDYYQVRTVRPDALLATAFWRADAELFAKAPTYIAELLAEVDRLREEARAFAEALGFGNGRTEPAATLAQMIDPLAEDRATAAEHIECAVMCESCGEVLAADRCEECHGSGCLLNAELAHMECGTCAGVGRIHVGCAEASYAELAARAEAAEQAIRQVRALHYAADNDVARTPVCSNCDGRAGVHGCGCWAEEDRQHVCGHCRGEYGSVNWHCATLRALDGGE